MEPPGTAPGSDPLITSAFMSIVPKDIPYIGEPAAGCKPGILPGVGNNYSGLGGPVDVGQYQPKCKDQFDSTKSSRLDQWWVVQKD